MSAIFFYATVYLIGYFGANVINLLTVKPLIRNRYMAALVPVVLVATAHAYKIVSTPPRQMQDTSMEYALGAYIIMPVIIVTLGAIYAMWNKKTDQNED